MLLPNTVDLVTACLNTNNMLPSNIPKFEQILSQHYFISFSTNKCR